MIARVRITALFAAAFTLALLCAAGTASAHEAQIAKHCPEGLYDTGGRWATIIADVQVRHITCRRGVKIVGAAMAGEALPAGWHCSFSSRSGFYRCGHGKRKASGRSGGDAG